MAEWIAPVYDRTAADVAAGAEKCYFSAEALNRIEGNLQYLADLLGATGVQTRSWTSTDFLRLSDMQRILANLAAVREAYYALPGSPDIRHRRDPVERCERHRGDHGGHPGAVAAQPGQPETFLPARSMPAGWE